MTDIVPPKTFKLIEKLRFKMFDLKNSSEPKIKDINSIPNSDSESNKSNDMDMKFAARAILDARDLRNFDYKKTEVHLRYYEFFLRREFSWIMHITILVNLSLAFIEKPTDLDGIPYWVPCLIEFICLLVYFLRWIQLYLFLTPQAFWKDKKNWILLIIFIVSTLTL